MRAIARQVGCNGQLQTRVSDDHVAQDGFFEPGRVGHQMLDSDGLREALVRNLQVGRQVAINRIVEVNAMLLDKLHDRDPNHGF